MRRRDQTYNGLIWPASAIDARDLGIIRRVLPPHAGDAA
jgi:hypothetical protein